jgi:uncharacterized damage-inducible protein DinB
VAGGLRFRNPPPEIQPANFMPHVTVPVLLVNGRDDFTPGGNMTNREFFHHLCSNEHPRFVGVLKATPGDTLDYQPHPRSRSARQLVGHLLGHEQDLVELLETGTINHRMEVPFDSMDDAVRIQTAAHGDAMQKLSQLSDADWEGMSRFLVQGNVIMEAPRRDLAWMLLLDAVHHRGQLSTYLRPMGGTVPSIYGPSADTMVAAT